MRKFIALCVFFIGLIPVNVRADDCPVLDGGTGKPIILSEPLEEPTRIGLAVSLMNALSDPDHENWPIKQMAATTSCIVGELDVDGTAFRLQTGQGHLPLAFASANGKAPFVFLGAGPTIEEAYALTQMQNPPAELNIAKPMFFLVVVMDGMRHVVRLYDAVPPADILKADMVRALKADLDLIADFDPDGTALSFHAATRSPVRAVLSPPLAGAGGRPARITAPDGTFFEEVPGNRYRMVGSGFACPASMDGYRRKDMWIANTIPERLDLSCRYVAEGSWFSIFVTRIPFLADAQAVFDQYMREAIDYTTPKTQMEPLLETGMPPRPAFGANWIDRNGLGQAIWLAKIGDWYVQLRLSYRPTDRDAAAKAALEFYKAAFADIAPQS